MAEVKSMATPGYYADGNGLYLQVARTGTKTWVYRFKLNGRRRDMGLGSVRDVTLAKARDLADQARKLVRDGVDPIEARKTAGEPEAAPVTFREAAEQYITAMSPGWRNPKHRQQWGNTLATYVYPVAGDVPVDAVSTDHVLAILTPIWPVKTETASRVRGRIEAILDWARAKGLREGENPARWRGHMDQLLPAKTKVARVVGHASLDYRDMGEFWPRLQASDGIGARALEFAILTAGRTGEVLGARWDEIDMSGAVWAIPGERMKAGHPHRVPLSVPALALLRKMAAIRTGEYVFPGARRGQPLSNMAMKAALRRMERGDLTPHGFRATFRTWAAECTSAPHEVCEAALAHTQGDKVVAAYQRGDLFDKRRRLMDQWAEYLDTAGQDQREAG